MITEGELIEIEGRAEALAGISEGILAALAESFQDGDDYRDRIAAIDASVARCATDIQRLVDLARDKAGRA